MGEKVRDLVAAYIIEDDRLLLVHNIKHGMRVEPPGGKKESDETHEAAVKRECLEELGVRINVDYKIGIYHTHSPEGIFDVHTYKCSIVEGDPTLNEPHKHDKIEYYNYEQLLVLKKDGFLVPNLAENLEHVKTILQQ